MSIEIKTPAFPESISEGEIATWNFAEGDAISEGDIIVEVETDKVVMEVPAIKSGVMGKILKKEGDTVSSQETIGSMEEGKKGSAAAPSSSRNSARKSSRAKARKKTRTQI